MAKELVAAAIASAIETHGNRSTTAAEASEQATVLAAIAGTCNAANPRVATAATEALHDEKKEAKTTATDDTDYDKDAKEARGTAAPVVIPAQAEKYIETCNWEMLFKNYPENKIIEFFHGAIEQFDRPDIKTGLHPIHYAMRMNGKSPTTNKTCGQITALLISACDDLSFISCKATSKLTAKNETILYSNVTPLFMAVWHERPVAIPLLLGAGANPRDLITEERRGAYAQLSKFSKKPSSELTSPLKLARTPSYEKLLPLFEEFDRSKTKAESPRHPAKDTVNLFDSMFV